MKKFLSIFVALVLFTTPVCAGKQDVLVHNVDRVFNVIKSFQKLDTNMNNRNSLITVSMKIGELREAINSGQSIDIEATGGVILYYKALGQFEKGIDDLEHGLRDKNKEYIKEGKKHFAKGVEFIRELSDLVENQKVS